MATTRYNRSEVLSYFDLTEEQQIEALNESNDQRHAEERSYVEFKYPNRTEILPLDMFMKFDNNPVWDGGYSTSAFGGYYIKFNRSSDECLIAEKYC